MVNANFAEIESGCGMSLMLENCPQFTMRSFARVSFGLWYGEGTGKSCYQYLNMNASLINIKLLTITQPSMTEHEVAELRKLLELAKTTERKAEELAELILEIDRKYEKRLAQISVARKLQL